MAARKKTDAATAEKNAGKPKKSAREKDAPLVAVLDGGETYVNLDSEFKWTQNLTDGQRLFVFYYCNQSSLKKNAADAARLAGYSKNTANVQAAKFLRTKEILAELSNINSQLLKKLTKANMESIVKDIIERKIKRMGTRPLDFYDIETREAGNGCEYSSAKIKTPEELTDEQREQVLDVDFVGQRGIPHYRLPDKVQAENELLKIYKEFVGVAEKGGGFETELTIEQIKDKVTAKLKVIQKKDEEERLAGRYIDEPENLIEEA